MSIESLSAFALWHMTHAHRLERHGREALPAGRRVDLRREPAGVLQIPPQAPLQTLHALLPDEEPELEGPEAAAEWDAPVAEVSDFGIRGGTQVARIGRHHTHEVLRVADEIG